MHRAWQMGMVVETPIDETIADGLAGRLVSPLILETVKRYVDDIVVVSEKEIIRTILFLLQQNHTLVEGAAAVSVAALSSGKIDIEGKTCVAVLTGRNIDIEMVRKVMGK